jgi:MFS transporter, DHA1 family, tetracycline resistance protein
MKLRNTSALSLIFLTVFVDLLGFGILIPILPTFAKKELLIDETAIGVAIAAYSLTQFFFNPVFGNLSDKYGRKKIIVICLLLNALGYVLFAYTHSFLMLLISRIVSGIGGSSIGVAQAYIADVTKPENRSKGMGIIGAAFGLGFVFGPLIGGLLSKYGYFVTGVASAFFSFAAFILTIIFLPEPQRDLSGVAVRSRKLLDISSFQMIYKKSDLSVIMILFFILTFSVANIYGTFALLGFKIYNFTDKQNGYMYAILGLSSAIVQGVLLARFSKYFSRLKIISIGALFLTIGLGTIPFGGNFLGLTFIAIILSLGTGSLQPTLLSLISEVTPETEQGITLGVNQSLSAFARVLGPLWGGFAFEYLGYPFPFLTGAFFSLIILILSLVYLPKILKLRHN